MTVHREFLSGEVINDGSWNIALPDATRSLDFRRCRRWQLVCKCARAQTHHPRGEQTRNSFAPVLSQILENCEDHSSKVKPGQHLRCVRAKPEQRANKPRTCPNKNRTKANMEIK